MADFVALSELVNALRTASENRKSGAFFITSSDQHSAMVTLAQGRVTGVKYRNKRGAEAAAAIAEMESVRFQTSGDLTELPGQSDLDSDHILGLLAGDDGAAESVQPTPEDASSDQDGDGGGGADDARLTVVRERYIAAIGPIGGAICDEELEDLGEQVRSGAGFNELVDRLASQIDDAAEAKSFRADVSNL